ncbi:MAG: hypothetical protein IPJ65_08475 [Archangiaceae bacterium]|nr:hypothetical protein [Archangiaceae bacterium]
MWVPGAAPAPNGRVSLFGTAGGGLGAVGASGGIGGGVSVRPVAMPQSRSIVDWVAAPGADALGGGASSSWRARSLLASSLSACSNKRRAPSWSPESRSHSPASTSWLARCALTACRSSESLP